MASRFISCCGTPHNNESDKLLLNTVPDPETHEKTESDHSEDFNGTSKHSKYRLIGYAVILLAVLELSFGTTCCQFLDRSIPHSELNGLRYAIQIVIAVGTVMNRNCGVKIQYSQIGWTFLLCCAMLTSSYTTYGSSYYLPIGVSSGVTKSSALLVLYIITSILNRTMTKRHFTAVVICLVGMVLVLQPTFIFHHHMKSVISNNTGYHSPCRVVLSNDSDISETNATIEQRTWQDQLTGYSLVVVEVVATTTVVLLVKYKVNDVDTVTLLFWASLLGVVLSFGLMGITETPTLPRISICQVFLGAHMLLSGTHNFLFVYGFKIVPPTMSGLLLALVIPVNFILQYTLLSGMYPGQANYMEMIGAMMVFSGNLLVPVYESMQYFKSSETLQ